MAVADLLPESDRHYPQQVFCCWMGGQGTVP